MSTAEQELEALLRERGLEWAIDMFAPRDKAADFYLKCLVELENYMKPRNLGTTSFSPDWIRRLITVSPYKADAFLQALVTIRGTPMLCAAWRILQGMDILSMNVTYQRLEEFKMTVELKSVYGETERYESSDINDATFLRHIGKSKIDEKPLFDGFFALNLK